jgi:hypothetical protein
VGRLVLHSRKANTSHRFEISRDIHVSIRCRCACIHIENMHACSPDAGAVIGDERMRRPCLSPTNLGEEKEKTCTDWTRDAYTSFLQLIEKTATVP